MFGAPPPPSKEELIEQEQVAYTTLTGAYITCALLYLSPFVVEYAGNFF